MGHDLGPIGPWPKQSLGTSPSPSLMVSPFRFGCMIDKPIPIKYDLVGDTFTRTTHDLGNSVLPWGVLLPSNLLEVGTSSNAITTIFNEAHSLARMIKSDPTHTSVARTQS